MAIRSIARRALQVRTDERGKRAQPLLRMGPTRRNAMTDEKSYGQELRDKKLNPPPETHRTNNGSSPSNSHMNGSPNPDPVEDTTFGVVPKDDSPEFLEKRDGPKKGESA
jgi:hypothetical protein